MRNKILIAIAGVALPATLLFAQGLGPKSWRGHPGYGLGPKAYKESPGKRLGLTEEQKTQAKAIFGAAREEAKPLLKRLRSEHEALSAAIRANDAAKIEQAAKAQAEILSQLTAIRGKAMAKFYATLTPEQKAQADRMEARLKERMRNRAFGKRG